MAAIAEDTGIEVEALGGAPGVRSARFAGEPPDEQANVDKVLAELAGRHGPEQRRARFVTVAVAMWPDGTRGERGGDGRRLDSRTSGGGAAGSGTTRCSCHWSWTVAPSGKLRKSRPTPSTLCLTGAGPSGRWPRNCVALPDRRQRAGATMGLMSALRRRRQRRPPGAGRRAGRREPQRSASPWPAPDERRVAAMTRLAAECQRPSSNGTGSQRPAGSDGPGLNGSEVDGPAI